MRIDKHTSLKDFLSFVAILSEERANEVFAQLENVPIPQIICGKQLPSDLNSLTFGELISLQNMVTIDEMLFIPLKLILGIGKDDILSEKAFSILGFMIFIRNELERIGKLFEKIRHRPTSQEVEAGIHQMNHGIFGVIDWYARRMGITDHEQVEKVQWVRIYKCMSMDEDNANYEKRLREIISKTK